MTAKTDRIRAAFYHCTAHGRFHGCSYQPSKPPPEWMICVKCSAVSYRACREMRRHVSVSKKMGLILDRAAAKRGCSASDIVEAALRDLP